MLPRKICRFTSAAVLSAAMLAGTPMTLIGADKDDKPAKKEDEPKFDSVFLKDAAQRVLGEIELSRLVEDQSSSDGVKRYARIQINAYRQLLEDLRTTAAARDVKLPTDLTDHQQDAKKRFGKLKGEDFDKQYMSDQMDEQQSLVNLFDRATRDVKEDKLKEFAVRHLPGLRNRVDAAKDLYRTVKKD